MTEGRTCFVEGKKISPRHTHNHFFVTDIFRVTLFFFTFRSTEIEY